MNIRALPSRSFLLVTLPDVRESERPCRSHRAQRGVERLYNPDQIPAERFSARFVRQGIAGYPEGAQSNARKVTHEI